MSQKINYLIDEFQYDVVLCTSEHKNRDYVYPLNEQLTHIDLSINYNRTKSYFHPENLLRALKHYKKLKKTIKELKPDIIISVNYTPEQYFLPFIEKQIPKIKEFHSSGVTLKSTNSLIGKFKYQLFKLFGRYDSLVVLNPDEKKYYPFKNVEVIPNFIKLSPQSISSEKGNTIIAAGRIAPVKQFDHLIKAWSHIANKFPDWQVKIYGDGDDQIKSELNKLISELKIPNIRLMGPTSHLKDKMEKASIYAMTSATECFPMVLLEAQAAKMAIISYDCPNGPRNIVKHDMTGILTELNSINGFSKALENLLTDAVQLNMLSEKAEKDVKRFSESEIMAQWKILFKKL